MRMRVPSEVDSLLRDMLRLGSTSDDPSDAAALFMRLCREGYSANLHHRVLTTLGPPRPADGGDPCDSPSATSETSGS